MRIMIADDEAIVRVAMKTMVEWEKHGHSIVGEAGDGQSAYEMAQKLCPDIMLVDIIMPKMTGLELIRKMKKSGCDCKFIILSCMDEYKYLQEAISLGVSEYFIKNTIEPNEIMEVVQRVSDDISRHRVYDFGHSQALSSINKKVVLNEFINQVLKSNIRQEDVISRKIKSFNIGLNKDSMLVMVMDFESEDAQNAAENQMLADICQGIVDSAARGYVFVNYEDVITAIISNEDKAETKEFIDDICYRMTESIKQYFDSLLKIGVSSGVGAMSGLSEGYREAKEALKRSFVDDNRQVFIYTKPSQSVDAETKIKALYNRVVEIKDGERAGDIAKLLDKIRACTITSGVSVDFIIRIYKGILYHIHEMGQSEKAAADKGGFYPDAIVNPGSTLNKVHAHMKEELCKIEKGREHGLTDKSNAVIDMIKKYVDDNIDRKITLKEISEFVHFNPDYLCRFFKKNMNMTLISYIKQAKMIYAAQLVKKGMQNAEIIQKIGYSSASYFIKDFKKHTGMSPKSYKTGSG